MQSWISLIGLLLGAAVAEDTGNHPEWPRWCGKVYKPEYPSFDPGGQTTKPPKLPEGPALYMQVHPRYSIYLEGEDQGEFIVDAEISNWRGQPWANLTAPETAPPVIFTINLQSNNDVLISNNITAGTRSKVLSFNLTSIEPRLEPYKVVLFGAEDDGDPTVTATSEFFYLPEKETGSVTKLDNLNGGMVFRNAATGGKFVPLLPYGFYASCDGFLCENDAISAIKKYSNLGLNGLVPLTPIFDSRPVFEYFDDLDLKFMYDLRGYFQNLTSVHDQVTAVKDFEALYAYWGSDEPDGWQYPFNSTTLAGDKIRSIDPYHPIAVTLNCQNYYFEEYTAFADMIMEDVYPIGINSTFSKWGTACNTTYGDCGCDNCQGNVQDVSDRLDTLARYERWLGLWPKTKAHNPQSFHGEDYWYRDPTVDEEVAMNALAFNHDAKAIVSWVWPTSDALAQIHGKFANVVTKAPVVDFIVTGKARRVEVAGLDILDVAYWTSGDQLLLSVVNGGYVPINETVSITLPKSAIPRDVESVAWGSGTWKTAKGGVQLGDIDSMSTNMVIMNL